MAKVIGIRKSSFDFKDGNHCEGISVYFTEPLTSKDSQGESGDSFFLSNNKMAEVQYQPKVGDNIQILYNKYGKVSGVIKK